MRQFVFAFIAVGFVLLAGCKGPYAPLAHKPGSEPMQHSQRIVILDRNVRNALLYVNSTQQRTPGGHIVVRANFQNRFPNDDIWADVRVDFLDENNMVVDQTEWITTHFPAWQVTMVQGSSINPRPVKHTMLLRNLRTRDGNIRGTFGTVFEMPWFPAVVPN
ncbi:hypothetical protein [Desulfonatronum thiodismutans]|uniref:hypothetical protein n=1 Tax=Desulfonatronum thiodismutans TaxID=159290 RepID=UPI0004ABE483|nr:hypothetical protein [Desulfonatronum thiodismutans]